MNLFHNETFLRIAFLVFGIASIGFRAIHFVAGIRIPGLEPLISAFFWGSFWRWNKIRGMPPSGIYSCLYLLIISMNLYSGIMQIWFAIV